MKEKEIKKQNKSRPKKPISLHPLQFDEVVEDLLRVPPEPQKESRNEKDKTKDSNTK